MNDYIEIRMGKEKLDKEDEEKAKQRNYLLFNF